MTLVLVDHADGKVAKSAAELATFAKRISSPIAVVLANPGAGESIASQLANTAFEKVIVVEDGAFETHGIAAISEALSTLETKYSPKAVLIASSARGKEIAGRVAIRTNGGIITDAIDVASDLSCTQSVFGGSYVVKSRVSKGTPVITIRPSSIEAESTSNSPEIVNESVAISTGAKLVTITDTKPAQKGGRPELTEAKIVVSGGRGTNGDFKEVEAMADLLGGAVGASRAATDAGWYPHTHQVGQTGKTVSPQLYIACGISGAIQHRAGMQTSKTIVAINKDPEAPIFDLADFGVVGDLFAVLPQAREAIKSKRG